MMLRGMKQNDEKLKVIFIISLYDVCQIMTVEQTSMSYRTI